MIQSNVGEKIRKLRKQRKMTQSELAGDQITRNMLSYIETGAALPSLPTIWYLAERLDVPAGFLLAEGDDDRIWRKMNEIADIKRLFGQGDPRICLAVCQSFAEDADDEICLIMVQCLLRIAQEEMHNGHLHACCEALDEALLRCEQTVYDTEHFRQTAALYFRFLRGLSSTLYPAGSLDIDDAYLGSSDAFGRYILAREALESSDRRRVDAYLQHSDRNDPFYRAFAAHCDMTDGYYAPARQQLLQLLNAEGVSSQVLLYHIFCDLEIACRETGDFRGAYEYSRNKITQLERMLER